MTPCYHLHILCFNPSIHNVMWKWIQKTHRCQAGSLCYNKAINSLFIVITFSIFHAGERSLFIIHYPFSFSLRATPLTQGAWLPLTGSAKVKGHACLLHSVEDSESKASFLLVIVSLEGKQMLWTCCAYNMSNIWRFCAVFMWSIMNNENFAGSSK